MKELKTQIRGLETQVTTAENNLTELRAEMKGRLKAADIETNTAETNLSVMARDFHNLRRKYTEKSGELDLLKRKHDNLVLENKKESNKKRAELIIVKSKLQIEKEKNTLLKTKLDAAENKNRVKVENNIDNDLGLVFQKENDTENCEGNVDLRHECIDCDKTFLTIVGLSQHMDSAHPKSAQDFDTMPNANDVNSNIKKKEKAWFQT